MKKLIQKLAINLLRHTSQRYGVITKIPSSQQETDEVPTPTRNEDNAPANDNSALNNDTPELRKTSLQRVHETISHCRKCPLAEHRKNTVPGHGSLDARVFVIGEAPGMAEDKEGVPFVGASGQYLNKWLATIPLNRERDVFITNIAKCRPPQNRNPSATEVQACIGYLHEQITLVQPDVIFVLGRVAAHAILDTGASLRELRTHIHRYNDRIPLLVSYHPSAVLRDPSLRRPVWNDLQMLKELL